MFQQMNHKFSEVFTNTYVLLWVSIYTQLQQSLPSHSGLHVQQNNTDMHTYTPLKNDAKCTHTHAVAHT